MYIIKIDRDLKDRLGETGFHLYSQFDGKQYDSLKQLSDDLKPGMGIQRAPGILFKFTSKDKFNVSLNYLCLQGEPIGNIEETT